MSDVYENCPAFENDKFLLRFSQLDDAEDLVSVYSDKNALPFFNSDNCHGDNFYYPNEDRMRQAIEFWLSSYSSQWTVSCSHENSYFLKFHFPQPKVDTSLWMNWKQKKRRDFGHAFSSPLRELFANTVLWKLG